MATIQIFLSMVSAEFRSYRDALCRDLDRPDVTVKVQEDFIATGTETLDKLDRYIRQCDAVIHLIGDMTGALAQPPSIAVIRKRYPDLTQRVPVLANLLQFGAPALSYTQWEAWLSLYHRKVLIIAVPDEGAPRDVLCFDEAQRTAQQEHLARLASVERYPEIRFTNADRLAIDVLRSSLHDILASVGAATDKELQKRAAERRWEHVQNHPIAGIEVLLLLKTHVGYDWLRNLLNDTSLTFSRAGRSLEFGQLLQQTSTAPNTKEQSRDSDEPICAFWDIYEREAGFWVRRIDPTPLPRTLAAGFGATIPWSMIGLDKLVKLRDLGLLTEVGFSLPARAFQVGVEEFSLTFYGETFNYEVNFSDHGLEELHEVASVQHRMTTSDKLIPLGIHFSGVQLLENFLQQMPPRGEEESTKNKRERFMMGWSTPDGREIMFYPAMPSSFSNSLEEKQYTFRFSMPAKIDSKLEIAKLHQQLQSDPSNPELHVRLASLYSYEGRLTDVLNCLQAAVNSGVTSADIHCFMAATLRDIGRHEDALSHAENAVILAPENAWAETSLGISLADFKRHEEALAHFEAAVRLDPSKAKYHSNLALAYSRVKKYEQSIGAYQEALRLNDNDARSHMMLGMLLGEQGDDSSAHGHLEAAVRIDPKSHDALSGLGRYHALRDEHELAAEYFQEAIKFKSDRFTYEMLGGSYAACGRWVDAENALRKAVELDPDSGSFVRNLATCLANQGKLDEALRNFEEACRIDPTDTQAQEATNQLRAHIKQISEPEDGAEPA